MADNFTTNAGSGGSTFASDDIGGVQYPRTKLAWGVDGAAVDASGTNPFPTSNNATIFAFSTSNTSVAQLAAGATFPGVIETALDQPSISLLLASDQPITLTIQQFIDVGGTRAVPDIVLYTLANTGLSRSLPLNGNYVRVTAQNTGAATTTTFSLNTAYGNLPAADSSGALPTTELPLVLTGAAAQTAVVSNILSPVSGTAPIVISGFRGGVVQVNSTGTAGTFIFEQSLDNVNWFALPIFNAAQVTAVPITAAITAAVGSTIYTFPLRGNFLRLRIATLITGGSIQAFTRLSSDPWTAAAQLIGNNVAANLQATVSGTVTVNGTVTSNIGTGSIAAGTNAIGDVGIQYRANNTGAASVVSVLSPAATAVGTIKASAGRLLGWQLQNSSAAVRSVKIFNATAPTLGTTAATFEIDIPAGGRAETDLGGGIGFATAITWSATSAKGLTDNTATGLAVNDVSGAFFFA